MRPSITEDVEDHPGKMRLSIGNLEIYVDEVLNIPVGMVFAAIDDKTKKPKICTLTYGGVLIEEFNSSTTPKMLHEMIEIQQKNAFDMTNMIIAKDNAMEEAKNAQEKTEEDRNRDVS
jgi:hypothetical protein